jgi:hypothetical protein
LTEKCISTSVHSSLGILAVDALHHVIEPGRPFPVTDVVEKMLVREKRKLEPRLRS